MHRIVYFAISISLGVIFSSCEQPVERLPFYNTPDFTPIFLETEQDIETQVSHTIGKFEFTNQDSSIINQKDLEGKIHIANFIFTSCGGICPKMTSNMNMVSDVYANDEEVIILSFTVMPWIDTPEILSDYYLNKGIENTNWHFLTGNKSEIYDLARTSYFAEEEIGFSKDSLDFLHTEHFMLVDKNLRLRGIYNGTIKLDVKQLIADIELLKKE